MTAVNDNAERRISLITSFNNHLSNSEEEKQLILQLVEAHRQSFPSSNKKVVGKRFEIGDC